MFSRIRSSNAAFASAGVILFAASSLRRMLVASTRASSGACSEPVASTSSAHLPFGPESTRAATSTYASMTALNVGQRRAISGSARSTRGSGTLVFSFALVATRRPRSGERPSFPAPLASTLASISLQGGASCELVTDFFRYVADCDLDAHAGTMPALDAVCSQSMSVVSRKSRARVSPRRFPGKSYLCRVL